jgi:hypothetical protein
METKRIVQYIMIFSSIFFICSCSYFYYISYANNETYEYLILDEVPIGTINCRVRDNLDDIFIKIGKTNYMFPPSLKLILKYKKGTNPREFLRSHGIPGECDHWEK